MSHDVSRQRTALITGANRGIGREVTAHLHRCGLRVIATARTEADAARTAEWLGPGASGETLDVTDPDGVERARDRIGPVDVLVSNAGVLLDGGTDPLNVGLDLVERTLAVNLLGAWRVAQAFVPGMVSRGGAGSSSSPAASARSASGCSPAHPATRCRRWR